MAQLYDHVVALSELCTRILNHYGLESQFERRAVIKSIMDMPDEFNIVDQATFLQSCLKLENRIVYYAKMIGVSIWDITIQMFIRPIRHEGTKDGTRSNGLLVDVKKGAGRTVRGEQSTAGQLCRSVTHNPQQNDCTA